MSNDSLQIFEDKKVRTTWDEQQEKWYFSIVDVIAMLHKQNMDLKRKL